MLNKEREKADYSKPAICLPHMGILIYDVMMWRQEVSLMAEVVMEKVQLSAGNLPKTQGHCELFATFTLLIDAKVV